MAYYLNLASVTATMTTLISATYALQRQKIAVERTLYARSAEESQLAARWASAWHKLVQRILNAYDVYEKNNPTSNS